MRRVTMRSLFSSSFACLFLNLVVLASSCFITNCPPGGKRSGGMLAMESRQCQSCGPPGSRGHCYGPSICCSPEFGCLMGTPETYNCVAEARFTTPCKNPGSPCSGGGEAGSINGQCAGDGICCTSETCTLDEACHVEESLASLQASLEQSVHVPWPSKLLSAPDLFHSAEWTKPPALNPLRTIYTNMNKHRHFFRHTGSPAGGAGTST